jgi:hypothetical protein
MLKWMVLALVLPLPAWAHGGGLNADGCHNDRKRGGYHCHGAKPARVSSPPPQTFLAAQPSGKPQVLFRCPTAGGGTVYTSTPSTGCVVVATSNSQLAPQAQSLFSAPARGSATYFANCSEARAAGAAPVRVGQPGYSARLDRDGDGVGCE